MRNSIKLVIFLALIIVCIFLAVKLQNRFEPKNTYKPDTTVTISTATSTSVITISPTPQRTINPSPEPRLQGGFVYITDVIPTAYLDIRYYSTYNFVGERIDGYKAAKAILTTEAANALKTAADSLFEQGYIITIYDAYRPVKAVNHFVRWAEDPNDDKMKDIFYPSFYKSYLIGNFISAKSTHSRGSTIDLSLLDFEGNEVDMGGYFDLFDSLSRYDSDKITNEQKENRKILRDAMVNAGFTPSSAEWWHFRLINEPFTDTYFDFDVE